MDNLSSPHFPPNHSMSSYPYTSITDREVQNPESFRTTTSVKSPRKQFLAVTDVWSWDLIGIFFTRNVGCILSQKIIEVSQIVTQSAAMLAGKLTCFALWFRSHCHAFAAIKQPLSG